jgi:hypothetical protein
MKTFPSRWGFHPCDYPTFLKLMRIHKVFWAGLRKFAAWQRWHRKLPHNRVLARWDRDAAGRKIRRVPVGPWPEPVVPDVVRAICQGGYPVLEDYHNARHGQPADQVRPLRIPLVVLDAWIEELDRLDRDR